MIPLRDRNRSATFPVVTVLLIVACAATFLFELTLGGRRLMGLFYFCGMVPERARLAAFEGEAAHGVVYVMSLFTSMFLHGGWLHVIGNVWYLWIFGDNVEDRLGHGRFLAFYLLCGVIAALSHTVFNLGSEVPTIGASGAIAGVLGAYVVCYPRARVLTLVPIFVFITFVEVPAIFFLGLWFLLQIINHAISTFEVQSVAWMAHIGGFIAGMLLIAILPQRRGFRTGRVM